MLKHYVPEVTRVEQTLVRFAPLTTATIPISVDRTNPRIEVSEGGKTFNFDNTVSAWFLP